MGKGGFSCVMCKNISGRNPGIKFFRFSKDREMSKLWVKACNRTRNKTTEELYKNDRICSVHFNENMYLNDLKTRLLPRAISNAIQTTSNFMENPNCDTYIISQESTSGSGQEFYQELENTDELSYGQMELIPTDEKPMISEERNISREEIEELDSSKVLEKQIQTPQKLSYNTPRKNKLKARIRLLQRENKKLKEQLKSALNKSKIKENLQYYCQLTEKILSLSIATFVKEQAKLNQQSIKGRKYSMQFKQFCLSIYFAGPKSYKILRRELILPSLRTLQRSLSPYKYLPD